MNPWRTHSSRTVYENPWIRVVENDVTQPGGKPGIYGVVHFRHRAVGVLPVDEEGHTWLVGQYRYATESYEWEIPEGGAHGGETLLECAGRELREETGLAAVRYDLIVELLTSDSVCDERAAVFLARGLTRGEAAPEETEELAVRRVTLEEAFEMVARREIKDSMSVAGLLRLQVLLLQAEGNLDAVLP